MEVHSDQTAKSILHGPNDQYSEANENPYENIFYISRRAFSVKMNRIYQAKKKRIGNEGKIYLK